MPIDFAGAAVGTAFGELFSLIKKVVQTVRAFGPELQKIDKTFSEIEPIIKEWDEYNKMLDRNPKEMDPIKNLFDKGKALVEKCSKIHRFNVVKKGTHSKELTEFDAEVLREFQIYMPVLTARINGEILWEVRAIRDEVQEFIHLGQANGGALQSGLEPLGDLVVPEDPYIIVGSGVEASKSKLEELLLKEGASVIVVTAPGGCGKTTLLRKLCHEVAIEGKFKDKIMFVRVSKKPNLTDIVRKMYQHNHFKVPEIKSEDGAVPCLQQLLKKIGQDPVLLVLDDVWKESESIVDKFVRKDIKDYKIVVTSRYDFPRFRPVHRLNPLTHDEAVELFRRSVTVDDISMGVPDARLLNEIVQHCKELPLVIKVVAKSLRGKDYAFWQRKLLELSEGHSLLDSEKEILACLKKSLEDLDGDPSIKERFMDLGSFPEDCKIPVTALIDMWVELYRLDPDGVRAITDLHELVSRNLANLIIRRDSSDDNEYYSSHYYGGHYAVQHDLLRELAIMECNEGEIEKRERLNLELHGNKFPDWWSEQKQQPLGARLLSISTDRTFSTPWPNLELPKVEALVLNFHNDMQSKTYALPEFVEKAGKLKALIVTNHSFFRAELGNIHVIGSNVRRIRLQRMTVPFLSMGNLRLQSLKKISFFMCDISQALTSSNAKISDAMPNLEELDIDYCDNLVTLPDDICQIKPLRKLSITNCHRFSALSEQIGELASMEVVRLNSCTTLSRLPDSIRSLQKVRLLDISDCFNLCTLPHQIGQMVNLERINMRGCLKLSKLPSSMANLSKLRKVVCEAEKTAMWEPLQDTLISLKITLSVEEVSLDWLEE